MAGSAPASGGSGTQYGKKHTGGIKYEGRNRKSPENAKPKDKLLLPHRVAIAMQKGTG